MPQTPVGLPGMLKLTQTKNKTVLQLTTIYLEKLNGFVFSQRLGHILTLRSLTDQNVGSDLLSSASSLAALLNYISDLARDLTGGEIEQIAVIVEDAEVIENEVEDLVTIINNLLQSHISWSEIVGKEELVGNNVNRNTRIFEKLVAKLKDFMDDSDNELNIALDIIVAKKCWCW